MWNDYPSLHKKLTNMWLGTTQEAIDYTDQLILKVRKVIKQIQAKSVKCQKQMQSIEETKQELIKKTH